MPQLQEIHLDILKAISDEAPDDGEAVWFDAICRRLIGADNHLIESALAWMQERGLVRVDWVNRLVLLGNPPPPEPDVPPLRQQIDEHIDWVSQEIERDIQHAEDNRDADVAASWTELADAASALHNLLRARGLVR